MVGLANATCPIEIVSPRLVWMPAALVIASRIAGSEAAGTEWSSSTETCWLSTAPGRDRGVGHGLAHAERGAGRFVLVVGLPAELAAAAGRLAVPVAAPVPAPLPVSVSMSLLCCKRNAGLAVGELFLGGLVDVHVGVDQHLRLARPERLGEHRVEARGHALVIALLGFLHAVARAARAARGLWPQQLPRRPSVIVTLLSCSPGTLEATSWAIPCTELGGSEVVPTAAPRPRRRPGFRRTPGSGSWAAPARPAAPETPWTESIVSAS